MILVVGVLPFVSTLLGGIAVFRLQHRLHAVMAVAAGILVATALVDLIPEAVELIATTGSDRAAFTAGLMAVIGYLIYSSIDAFIHQGSYEHGHEPGQDPNEPHEHPPAATTARRSLGWLAPAGLIAHSTLDGLAIGLGFEAGLPVGIVVTMAVVVHDFADGLNIVTVALAGGRGRAAAVALLAIDALATIVGIAISQVVVLAPDVLGMLLALFGGAFVAIGASHLLPEAQHGQGRNISPLVVLTILGAMGVVVLRVIALSAE